jgi:hypothetical protein
MKWIKIVVGECSKIFHENYETIFLDNLIRFLRIFQRKVIAEETTRYEIGILWRIFHFSMIFHQI